MPYIVSWDIMGLAESPLHCDLLVYRLRLSCLTFPLNLAESFDVECALTDSSPVL